MHLADAVHSTLFFPPRGAVPRVDGFVRPGHARDGLASGPTATAHQRPLAVAHVRRWHALRVLLGPHRQLLPFDEQIENMGSVPQPWCFLHL